LEANFFVAGILAFVSSNLAADSELQFVLHSLRNGTVDHFCMFFGGTLLAMLADTK